MQVEALKADAVEKEGMVLVEGGAMERIRRASELALTEMKLMGAQVVEEQKRRKEAERLVQHSVSEMQAARRQSAIMKGSTVDQKQLSDALTEIESLSNQLAELKSKHKEEVRVGQGWCSVSLGVSAHCGGVPPALLQMESKIEEVASLQDGALLAENKSM